MKKVTVFELLKRMALENDNLLIRKGKRYDVIRWDGLRIRCKNLTEVYTILLDA